ncbi:MAG TPA: hypothetical protein VEQ63_07375 [Bryobacteraceae bacterium]|nr:hypothetical protein [Bryobacteraceae bacterium]
MNNSAFWVFATNSRAGLEVIPNENLAGILSVDLNGTAGEIASSRSGFCG